MANLSAEEKAKILFELALDKKPKDPVAYKAEGISPLWDYFIFLTVLSERQAEAIKTDLQRHGKKNKIKPHHIESSKDGWILMDFHDVVVHIFTEEKREFYGLEKFLEDAETTFFGCKIDDV